MNIITLDFETYFDDEYTLKKMTTEEYVRDPRFEVHGCAIKWGDFTQWFHGPDLWAKLQQQDWPRTAILCHHAQFDAFILSHHFNIRPGLILDTYSMARLMLGAHIGKGLDSLAQHFGRGAKNIPYELFRGKHWHELAGQTQQLVATGCCQDIALTWDIFCDLAAAFPPSEYAVVDATIRMFTEPALVGNTVALGEVWKYEENAKAALLSELGVTLKELGSNERFAELLRAEGVEPEMKAGKNGPIYAFAKTDDFMRDLEDDEDERVAMLAEARLKAKSNITQTRAERLGWMSTRGRMAVYLNYAGTHLAGWSGGDKLNWQNRKRGSPLEKALCAPPGYKIIIADASQVECRLLNKVAGQEDVIERFRNNEDPYVNLATTFYGETIYKPMRGDPRFDEMEQKRGTGKQGELSCGYGAGAATIKATAKKGQYGPPVYMSDEEALRLRDTYRSTHPFVTGLWDEAGVILKHMHAGLEFDWRGVVHIRDKTMYSASGVPANYHSLAWDDEERGFTLRTRRHGFTRIWGSKFVENLIQFLRNELIRTAWMRLRSAGLHIVSMEHDKLIALCPEADAEAGLWLMQEELARTPSWLPDIPLTSEGYISDTFAKP